MLARWYLLLGQFSVTFEYRPGSLHNNAGGMSRQCGQCRRPDCPVSAIDLPPGSPPPPSPVVRVLRNGSGAPLLATTDWEFES